MFIIVYDIIVNFIIIERDLETND